MDIVVGIVVSVAIVVAAYYYFKNAGGSSSQSQIVASTVDGRKQFDSQILLPHSFDDQKGMTFSYMCWLRFDDFSYKYGKEKNIFVKGSADLSAVCPGLFLDANTNSLITKIDTFGAQEVIPIPNIPAKKWLHYALVVDQDSVDIYINGTLRTHQTLTQLPRQNSGTVHVAVDGGFDGRIANLQYFNYFLTPQQVQSMMGAPPTTSPDDAASTPAPPYFDITWWTGRN